MFVILAMGAGERFVRSAGKASSTHVLVEPVGESAFVLVMIELFVLAVATRGMFVLETASVSPVTGLGSFRNAPWLRL